MENGVLLGLHRFHVVKPCGLALVSLLSQVVVLLRNLLELLLPHLLVGDSEVLVESVLLCMKKAIVSKELLGICLPEMKWVESGSGL